MQTGDALRSVHPGAQTALALLTAPETSDGGATIIIHRPLHFRSSIWIKLMVQEMFTTENKLHSSLPLGLSDTGLRRGCELTDPAASKSPLFTATWRRLQPCLQEEDTILSAKGSDTRRGFPRSAGLGLCESRGSYSSS